MPMWYKVYCGDDYWGSYSKGPPPFALWSRAYQAYQVGRVSQVSEGVSQWQCEDISWVDLVVCNLKPLDIQTPPEKVWLDPKVIPKTPSQSFSGDIKILGCLGNRKICFNWSSNLHQQHGSYMKARWAVFKTDVTFHSLVGGWATHLKNVLIKFDHLPR